MASCANPDSEIASGGADGVGGPAGTGNRGGFVAGMNVCFHKKGRPKVPLSGEGATQNATGFIALRFVFGEFSARSRGVGRGGSWVASRREYWKLAPTHDSFFGDP